MESLDRNEAYKEFKQHDHLLKNWLMAYSFGLPLILISQKHLWEKLADNAVGFWGILFLVGTGILQLLIILVSRNICRNYLLDNNATEISTYWRPRFWLKRVLTSGYILYVIIFSQFFGTMMILYVISPVWYNCMMKIIG